MRDAMLPTLSTIALTVSFLLVSTIANSTDILTCEQKQNMCKALCQTTHINDEKGLGTCEAKCLGQRVQCSVLSNADKVKEATESAASEASKEAASFSDKAKAFWDGLTE